MHLIRSVRHGDHSWASDRVRNDGNVRRSWSNGPVRMLGHRAPALRRWHHRSLARRAPSEGLRSRQRHLSIHRYEHLRDNRLEELLACNHQHWPRYLYALCNTCVSSTKLDTMILLEFFEFFL